MGLPLGASYLAFSDGFVVIESKRLKNISLICGV